MHNRPLTEIGRRAGELALVWFEAVMPQESSEFIDAADEDELESVEGLRESQENVVGDAPVSDGYVGGFVEGAREIRAAVADQIQASAEGAKAEPARGDLVEVLLPRGFCSRWTLR